MEQIPGSGNICLYGSVSETFSPSYSSEDTNSPYMLSFISNKQHIDKKSPYFTPNLRRSAEDCRASPIDNLKEIYQRIRVLSKRQASLGSLKTVQVSASGTDVKRDRRLKQKSLSVKSETGQKKIGAFGKRQSKQHQDKPKFKRDHTSQYGLIKKTPKLALNSENRRKDAVPQTKGYKTSSVTCEKPYQPLLQANQTHGQKQAKPKSNLLVFSRHKPSQLSSHSSDTGKSAGLGASGPYSNNYCSSNSLKSKVETQFDSIEDVYRYVRRADFLLKGPKIQKVGCFAKKTKLFSALGQKLSNA